MFKNKKILVAVTILIVIVLAVLLTTKSASKSGIVLENGVQVIRMTESIEGYMPNSFTLKKGVPVRWEIEASADRTCASALIVPDYKIREFLKPGKNIVEFTPDKVGTVPFSCSMRMYTGKFYVID